MKESHAYDRIVIKKFWLKDSRCSHPARCPNGLAHRCCNMIWVSSRNFLSPVSEDPRGNYPIQRSGMRIKRNTCTRHILPDWVVFLSPCWCG